MWRPSAAFTRVRPSEEKIIDIDAPDIDPAAGEASLESIALAREQYADQKALRDEFAPLYRQNIELALAQQAKNNARSDVQWDTYNQYALPNEKKFFETAANYDTQGRRDQAATEAQSGVASSFDTARQGLTESLQAQGAAGSGRGLAMGNVLAIEEAKAKAGAGNAARRDVERTGLNLVGSAANFGRNLPNTGLSAGTAGMQSGQAAMGGVSGLSGLTGAGYSQALQGYGVGINGLTGVYQAQNQATGQQNGIFGDMLGAGAGIAGMIFNSSKDKKLQGSPVSGKKALRGLSDLAVEDWTYKPGEGDGGSHIGPYAEDVQKRFGDRVAPGGQGINMVEMSNVNAKAIAELARELKALNAEIKALEAA